MNACIFKKLYKIFVFIFILQGDIELLEYLKVQYFVLHQSVPIGLVCRGYRGGMV